MAALAVKADKKGKKDDKKDKKKDKKNDKQKVEKGNGSNKDLKDKSETITFKASSHNDELPESSKKSLARNMFKTAWFAGKDKNE